MTTAAPEELSPLLKAISLARETKDFNSVIEISCGNPDKKTSLRNTSVATSREMAEMLMRAKHDTNIHGYPSFGVAELPRTEFLQGLLTLKTVVGSWKRARLETAGMQSNAANEAVTLEELLDCVFRNKAVRADPVRALLATSTLLENYHASNQVIDLRRLVKDDADEKYFAQEINELRARSKLDVTGPENYVLVSACGYSDRAGQSIYFRALSDKAVDMLMNRLNIPAADRPGVHAEITRIRTPYRPDPKELGTKDAPAYELS